MGEDLCDNWDYPAFFVIPTCEDLALIVSFLLIIACLMFLIVSFLLKKFSSTCP